MGKGGGVQWRVREHGGKGTHAYMRVKDQVQRRTASSVDGREDANASADVAQSAVAMARLRSIIIFVNKQSQERVH